MKRILALLILAILPTLLLSNCTNDRSNKPYLKYLGVSLDETDISISQNASFQSTDKFDVEFDYPEGSLSSVYIAVTDGRIDLYDGPRLESDEAVYDIFLNAQESFPYYPEDKEVTSLKESTSDPSRYSCDGLDWVLPVSSISGLPIRAFSCYPEDPSNEEESVEVMITANNGRSNILIQALVYLDKGGSIDDLKKMVNDFVKTLYIDFDQWREINKGRRV